MQKTKMEFANKKMQGFSKFPGTKIVTQKVMKMGCKQLENQIRRTAARYPLPSSSKMVIVMTAGSG
jgi:hypothetical protein